MSDTLTLIITHWSALLIGFVMGRYWKSLFINRDSSDSAIEEETEYKL